MTVNTLLGTAGMLEGKHVRAFDQTGLSQKGGPVVSSLKLADRPMLTSNKVGAGEANLYLGFDILVATQPVHLEKASPDRTQAVISTSQIPTGDMVRNKDVHFPAMSGLRTDRRALHAPSGQCLSGCRSLGRTALRRLYGVQSHRGGCRIPGGGDSA